MSRLSKKQETEARLQLYAAGLPAAMAIDREHRPDRVAAYLIALVDQLMASLDDQAPAQRLPVMQLVQLYREVLTSLPAVTDEAGAGLAGRALRDICPDLDSWRATFERVSRSPILMGSKMDDGRIWTATFAWLCGTKDGVPNKERIDAGQYDDRRPLMAARERAKERAAMQVTEDSAALPPVTPEEARTIAAQIAKRK